MKLPLNYTRLYITGEPISQSALGYLCGKQNIYVDHITMLEKRSAIVDIRYGKETDLSKLMKNKDYNFKRIFKAMKMKRDEEKKEVNGVPVFIGFIVNTGANLLGLLNGKKKTIYIDSNSRTLKKLFVKYFMKMRDERKYDMIFQPEADINFIVKRIRNKNSTYIITWAEGKDFSNSKTM